MSLPLLSRRLVFLTGKGGVGKTTVALALGRAVTARGMRAVVAQLEDDSGSAAAERELYPGLYQASIDPQAAMEEYLTVKLPSPAGQMLRQSKLFGAFAMATPGMRELLCIGKLWELAQLERRTADTAPYDVVIVDAPASGRGAAMLRAPRTFAEIARVGPIAGQARRIAATLADPAFTAVAAVCTPEELPVNETLMLAGMLHEDGDPLELQSVILNCCHSERFDAAEVALLQQREGQQSQQLAALARADRERVRHERAQADRLRAQFGDRVRTLPYLFAPELELPQLDQLARELTR